MKFKHLTVNYSIIQLLSYSVILSLILFFSPPLKAQVTIGSLDPPHSFSILELIAKEKDGGLRLPQLKTSERLALNNELTGDDAAKGLTLYDIDLNCLEFWNGTDWVSMCSDVLPDCSSTVFPVLGRSYTFCTDATFSDLTASVGGKELWYDAATGGAAHVDTDPLVSGTTYYAEERVGACVSPTRAPVSVTLGSCTAAPTSGNVTTFTNVMYDFQHQTLQAYNSGGMPTAYQWQMSETTNNADFVNIAGAPNSNFYTVPDHFADSYANAGTDGLYFRCILSNSKGSTTTSTLNILFINTGTSSYGYEVINGDTIRYLTIQKGQNGINDPQNPGIGSIKIALLNLGQSEDDEIYNNDAGDLGDFYQWGRVKDGHEHIVWSKDPSTRANMFGDGTSTPIPGLAPAA